MMEQESISRTPLEKSAYQSRYDVVGKLLEGRTGTLIDLGSRDRVMEKYLKESAPGLKYTSADLEGTHDHQVNLEQKFPFKDNEFDYVVILDVLEHLENIHSAFDECVRIAKKGVIISLPNLATAIHRINFLRHGKLRTGKYDLLSSHQGDRHRWLTTYDNSNDFIYSGASRNNCKVVKTVGCRDFYSFSSSKVLNHFYSLAGKTFLSPKLFCNTVVFEVSKV